jgi:hypothetical protein
MHHYLTSASGYHDTIYTERFNRFLNAQGYKYLTMIYREPNRVFVKGAHTLLYAWNSCPILGTDLSQSLLKAGREYHFPINFETNLEASFDMLDKDKTKLVADYLTPQE